MKYQKMRGAMVACGAAAMLLVLPAQSDACGFFDCLFGGGAARTAYSVPYASVAPINASSCAPCGQRTCGYVPQTSYRTAYQMVPVTSYQAVAGCDPCTGCRRTTYRPVTSWTYQARLIPYTTYRPVYYSNPCNPCGGYDQCSPCGSCGAAGTTVLGSAGCGCEASSGTMVPQAEALVPQAETPMSDPETAPALEGTPQPRTFENSTPSGETPNPAEAIPNAIPSANLNSVPLQPLLSDPRGGRTTSRPVRVANSYRLIASPPEPVPIYRVPVYRAPPSNGGWRAASQ